MSLREYQHKRDFSKTAEPKGKVKKKAGKLLYIIQKHAASHLHYDFRLELDGVLKSWAIPKGPSLKPIDKRLAVQVEDHPLEYGDFEGTIPEGEYGGGTVMLWDRGTWEPIGDAKKSYLQGNMSFYLYGNKLQGLWKLIRLANNDKNWLLIKAKDEAALTTGDITKLQPLSVKTGRDMSEIAEAKGKQ